MDDSTTTSSSSSEMQKAQNQLHPLCKPFPVSPESETIDEVNFDWRSIASSVFNTGDSRPVVLFDGVCNLCNGAVNFSLDHDSKGKSPPPNPPTPLTFNLMYCVVVAMFVRQF
jgi:hypothetical protein